MGSYYVPERSHWPLVGSAGLFCLAMGVAQLLQDNPYTGFGFLIPGALIILYMTYGWFQDVILENRQGLHSRQMDRSYRWGMFWFIFSEVMFFGAFFGALFYIRLYSIPALGGANSNAVTHELLWPEFQAMWPLYMNPNNTEYQGPLNILHAWGIPVLNTALLLSSAVSLTWAHWALLSDKRKQTIIGMAITIVLGVIFLGCQAYEYHLAFAHDQLTLASGIYGSTFFMLTGFHGLHVTVGTIMLSVILHRLIRGDFSSQAHFGFEAAAWYWHFVDVVWLLLFVFVYII